MINSIYKYASASAAKSIIESRKVLVNAADQFNDPYDCLLVFNNNELKQISDLVMSYYCEQELRKLIYNTTIIFPPFIKPFVASIKLQFKMFDYTNNKHKEYVPLRNYMNYIRFFNSITLKKENANLNSRKTIEEILKLSKTGELETKLKENIHRKQQNILISCFSKKNDESLMWAHYADNNKGVCIEFEDEDSFKVIYSKRRTQVKLKKLVYKVLWQEYTKSNINENSFSSKESMLVILPFLTKSFDWKYEDEHRIIVSKTNEKVSEGFIKDEKRHFYEMKRIKSITLGCRIDSKTKEEIIQMAKDKNIDVFQMYLSSHDYSLLRRQI